MDNLKKFQGEVISIKHGNNDEYVRGMVVDYNDNWTMLINNPCDFIADGFIILKHESLTSFKEEEEEIVEKVFQLKEINIKESPNVPLDNLTTILNYLTSNFAMFQIQIASEVDTCYIGKLKSTTDKEIIISALDTDGTWAGDLNFNTHEITTIEFETDYIKSLILLNKNT